MDENAIGFPGMKIPMIEIKNEMKNKIKNEIKKSFRKVMKMRWESEGSIYFRVASWDEDAFAAFLSWIKMQQRHFHPGACLSQCNVLIAHMSKHMKFK